MTGVDKYSTQAEQAAEQKSLQEECGGGVKRGCP
jgi:hypothetical protein